MPTKKTQTVQSTGIRAGKTTATKKAIKAAINAGGEVVIHKPGAADVKLTKANVSAAIEGEERAAESKPPRKPAAKKTTKRIPAKKASKARRKASKPPEARSVGRPPMYRPEMCAALIAYFDIPVEKLVDVKGPNKEGIIVEYQEAVVNLFPTLTRFASQYGITRKTLHAWATESNADQSLKYPEFSYAYARARESQESLIIEGGMSGKYESRFVSLAAKNLAGWRDQIEQVIETTVIPADQAKMDEIYNRGIANAAERRRETAARTLSGVVPGAPQLPPAE